MTYFLLSSFLYYRHCRRKTVLPAPFNLVGYLLHYCTKIYDLSKNTGTYIFVVEILYMYSETQCTIANDLIGHIIVCPSNFPCLIKCLQFTELVELYLWHMSNYATRHPTWESSLLTISHVSCLVIWLNWWNQSGLKLLDRSGWLEWFP